MPSASAADAIVFAVYMPPQAPSPGQIAFSISVDLVAGHPAGQAGADGLERVDDRDVAAVVACPGSVEPA